MTDRAAPTITLAAGTVGGAGTEVALTAALAARPGPGSTAMVPPGFTEHARSSGWCPLAVGRAAALVREAIGAPHAEVWMGFCDRLPVIRRGSDLRVVVVQNPHLYRPLDACWSPAQRLKLRALAAWARRSVRTADVIVCSTGASAEDVAAATGVPRDRIEVLPIPATGITVTKASQAPEVQRVLLVGDVYAYKRWAAAVDAVRIAATTLGRRLTLVHVGQVRDPAAADELAVALERATAEGVDVHRRGRVPHDEVAAEMAAADVLLLTSTTETQGLPLVEAHAVGLPVLCRDIGPFRDLGGDAVATFPADAGPEEIARALVGLDPFATRTRLAELGRALHPPATAWDLVGLATRACDERSVRAGQATDR